MKRGFSVIVWLMVPCLAGAQATGTPGGTPTLLGGRSAGGLHEDIEVFRRLLNARLEGLADSWASQKECAACHGQPMTSGSMGGSDSGWSTSVLESGSNFWRQNRSFDPYHHGCLRLAVRPNTEGNYVKGAGIVYTLTLPPPGRDPRPSKGASAQRSPSDWDRIRRQVRGEKQESEDAGPEPKEPPLADVILRLLADYGRHFGPLGEGEGITVAVTFRELDGVPSKAAPKGMMPGSMPSGMMPGGGPSATGGPGMPGPGLFPPGGVPSPFGPGSPDGGAGPGPGSIGGPGGLDPAGSFSPSSARDYELLGDLHMKQNNGRKAIDAYTKALELEPLARQVATRYQKLAQALLTQAQSEEERSRRSDYFKRVVETLKKAEGKPDPMTGTGDAAAPAAPILPAKLTISASKSLLDQVGAGKGSFEDFKKAATVEYQTFSADNRRSPDKTKN